MAGSPSPPAQANARDGLTDEPRDKAEIALSSAKRFIANGIEFGYVRMPDADCPDPAHNTPKLIDDALALLAAHPGQPEPRAEVTNTVIVSVARVLSSFGIFLSRPTLRDVIDTALAGDGR